MTTLFDWIDRLQGVRKAGSDYKALCPAHADKNPSLSVSEGDDGTSAGEVLCWLYLRGHPRRTVAPKCRRAL